MDGKAVKIMLAAIILLLGASLVLQIEDRTRRAKLSKAAELYDLERAKVLKDLKADMGSTDTKDVFHQLYHVSNAQLRMLNLISSQLQASDPHGK